MSDIRSEFFIYIRRKQWQVLTKWDVDGTFEGQRAIYSFISFLNITAKHVAQNYLKREYRQNKRDERFMINFEDFSEDISATITDVNNIMEWIVGNDPHNDEPYCHELISWRILEGHSYNDIKKLTALTINQIRYRYFNCLDILRQRFAA